MTTASPEAPDDIILSDEFDEINYHNSNTLDAILRTRFGHSPRKSAEYQQPLPTTGLGSLDCLPPEILENVLYQADLSSLERFRQTNGRALELVESLPVYKIIVEHAHNSLRGVLSIGSGPWVTLLQLYAALCKPWCDSCSNFAGYIYLIQPRRVCILCFTTSLQYLPLRRARALKMFEISARTVDKLPHMRCIPGRYSEDKRKIYSCRKLIDFRAAREAAIAKPGTSVEEVDTRALDINAAALAKARAAYPGVTNPFFFASLEWKNPERFVAIVPAPWWDPSQRKVERGFYCKGCRESSAEQFQAFDSHRYRRIKYLPLSYREHLQYWGPVVNGKHSKYYN